MIILTVGEGYFKIYILQLMCNKGGNYYFSYLLCFDSNNASNLINNKVEYIN